MGLWDEVSLWINPTRAAWALVVIVKATLVLCAAFAVTSLARRSSAAIRHAAWSVALVGMPVVPALSVALPGWSLALLPAAPAGIAALSSDADSGSAGIGTGADANGGLAQRDATAAPALVLHPDSGPASDATTAPFPWGPLLLGVWLGGVSIETMRLVHGLARLRRWTERATELPDAGTRAMVEEMRRSLGVRRAVRVLRSADVEIPITWGWLHPVTLFPAAEESWSVARRRVVLLHELAHVRRLDWPVQLAAHMARILYWFHPLVWIAERQLQDEREKACDEIVLATGTKASEYAAHLVDIARTLGVHTFLPETGLSMASPGRLERRLVTMLTCRRPARRTVLSLLLTGLTMSAFVVSVSAVESLEGPPVPAASPATAPGPSPDKAPGPGALPLAAASLLPAPGPGPAVPMTTLPGAAPDSGASFTGRIREDGGTYVRIGHEGDDFVLEKREQGFSFSLRIEEPDQVEFSRDGREITRMGRGSLLVLRTGEDSWRHRLEVRPAAGGGLAYDWRVNGRERDYDDEAREWTATALEVAHGMQEAAELRGEENALRGKINSIRGHVNSLRGEINGLRGQRNALQGEINGIQGHENALQGKINEIRGHENSLRGRINSLRGEINGLRSRARHAEDDEQDEVKGRIDELNDRIRDVEREIEDYGADVRVQKVEREIEEYDADGRIREVQRRIRDLGTDERIRAIEREIDDYDAEAKIEIIERKIDHLDAQERAERIEDRLRPRYDELRRLSRVIR